MENPKIKKKKIVIILIHFLLGGGFFLISALLPKQTFGTQPVSFFQGSTQQSLQVVLLFTGVLFLVWRPKTLKLARIIHYSLLIGYGLCLPFLLLFLINPFYILGAILALIPLSALAFFSFASLRIIPADQKFSRPVLWAILALIVWAVLIPMSLRIAAYYFGRWPYLSSSLRKAEKKGNWCLLMNTGQDSRTYFFRLGKEIPFPSSLRGLRDGHMGHHAKFAIDPKSEFMGILEHDPGGVRTNIVDLASGEYLGPRILGSKPPSVCQPAFTEDGSAWFFLGGHRIVEIKPHSSEEEARFYRMPTPEITACPSFSSNGRIIAWAGREGPLEPEQVFARVLSIGKEVSILRQWTLKGSPHLSPNGKYLLVADGQDIHRIDIGRNQPRLLTRIPELFSTDRYGEKFRDPFWPVAFSPDGEWFLTEEFDLDRCTTKFKAYNGESGMGVELPISISDYMCKRKQAPYNVQWLTCPAYQ